MGQLAGFIGLRDQLQFLVFHDFAAVYIADPLEGEDDHEQLQSVGAGLRWQIRENLTVPFDYGWQIDDIGLDESSRAHLAVTLSY